MAKKFVNHKAREKMETTMHAAIWSNGKDRARITTILNDIKMTKVANHPAILRAVEILQEEKIRLLKELKDI